MTMENRNYYSLHCLQMETQLIHANIEILADIMQSFAQVELQGHKEVSIGTVVVRLKIIGRMSLVMLSKDLKFI